MPIVLVRIDDRLVHGQVVVGWGIQLNFERIVLCSDSIAISSWQKDIYIGAEATAPYSLTVSVFTIEETIQFLDDVASEKEKIVLLTESPRELLELIKRGLKIHKINVGGMHYKQGKMRLAPYIFVDEDDISSFKEIDKMEIELEGRDVPTGRRIDIMERISSLKK